MIITTELKQKIAKEIKERKGTFYGSTKKYAGHLNVNYTILTRLMNGETERLLSDANWITLARSLDVTLGNEPDWKYAETPVFIYVQEQLKKCQQEGISGLLCDAADIGKTFAAKHYARNTKAAVYIDCSQVKNRQRLVRTIAKEYGVGYTGTYAEVYEDLVFYLRTIPTPLVILDEAGDLQYEAFLELKALWNATERTCGWYMMGADGLKKKISRNMEKAKVGYTEIFSRYGKRYQRTTPVSKEENSTFTKQQGYLIIKANAPGLSDAEVQKLIRKTEGSLRRIYYELSKLS